MDEYQRARAAFERFLAIQEAPAPDSQQSDPAQASRLLGAYGVRLIEHNGVLHAGIWSNLDGPEVRAALAVWGSAEAPVLYLDHLPAGVADRFRQYSGAREYDFEDVPLDVVEAMYHNPEQPWRVRDALLATRDWPYSTAGYRPQRSSPAQ